MLLDFHDVVLAVVVVPVLLAGSVAAGGVLDAELQFSAAVGNVLAVAEHGVVDHEPEYIHLRSWQVVVAGAHVHGLHFVATAPVVPGVTYRDLLVEVYVLDKHRARDDQLVVLVSASGEADTGSAKVAVVVVGLAFLYIETHLL